ncbi:MAG: helix-turn-helix transcriptional regulator [Candidatus Thiodiazotropha sp. (ex. Lucinisca nassula)]|nr:helix-turn-helix transcriptional regulator [Candidatus Thiodiazotropha sp. (ex. Lucinisca nassula)]MBW9276206.1 helix-turn-helix transcriptional regulator [Candidatus Thiodiazotropha sp. (ex. Lucinisca nassula)]
MIEKGQDIICNTGNALTVPSPGSYDLRNEPDRRSGRYRALVIPFEVTDIEHLLRLHQLQPHHRQVAPQILHFNIQADLANAIRHYLTPSSDDHLIRHRLLELLLILLRQDERLMTYSLCQPSWSQKVRSIFATDLAKKWEIVEVCQRLAISESTLRRNLKREQTGFRDLLVEQRLSAALMLLLQTSQSITQIAYDCGYLSVSRFSSNFSKRFGLPPTELRISLNESEQKMTVCEQS